MPMATRRTRVGERRWPAAAAVLLTGALRITLPAQLRLNDAGPALFVVLFGLVIVGILADRGPIDRRATWRRVLTVLPIALITIANGGSTVRLVYGILFAEPFTQQARTLLAAGGVIWLTNVIAFGLWYWDLDRGGAVARALGSTAGPAFLFPEMLNPEHVCKGWCPTFVDYLHLSVKHRDGVQPDRRLGDQAVGEAHDDDRADDLGCPRDPSGRQGSEYPAVTPSALIIWPPAGPGG